MTSKMLKPCIADLGVVEVKSLKGQSLNMLQTGVADLAMAERQVLKPRQSSEVLQTSITDMGIVEHQYDKALHSFKMLKPNIRDLSVIERQY